MSLTRSKEFLERQLGGTWHTHHGEGRAMQFEYYYANFDMEYADALIQKLLEKGYSVDSAVLGNQVQLRISQEDLEQRIRPLASRGEEAPGHYTLRWQIEDELGRPHGEGYKRGE